MEALLCLPFLLLVFALVINVGHGWIVRARAETAARFAGSVSLAVLEEGAGSDAAREAARSRTLTTWYGGEEAASVGIEGGLGGGPVAALERQADGAGEGESVFARIGALVTGRQRARVEAPRRPPTGTLLPPTPVSTHLSVDGNPWHHAAVPLTFDAMTDVGTKNELPAGFGQALAVASYGGRGLFWLLGMAP